MIKVRRCIISAIKLLVGVRKMLITLVFMGVGLALLALKWVNGTEFINASRDVVVAFMATNLAEHLSKTIATWGRRKVVEIRGKK